MIRKRLLAIAAAVLIFAQVAPASSAQLGTLPYSGALSFTGWQAIKIGNGGLVIRYDVSGDGTMVEGTDTSGCAVWGTPVANQWNQLFTISALGAPGAAGDATMFSHGAGCDDIITDPSNGNNLWALYAGNVYKSTTKGVTWLPTNFPTQPILLTSITNPAKSKAPYSAIDPANGNIGFFGTPTQGIFRTTDGTNFTVMPALSGGLICRTGTGPSTFPTFGTDTVTSITPATGTINFTHYVGSNAGFGQYIKVWETSNPFNNMVGSVVTSGGGTLSLNVIAAFGGSNGAHTDWTMSFPMDGGNSGSFVGCGHRVAYDISGGTQANVYSGGGLCTKNVVIHTYGVNTFKSTDCGQNFSPVSQTNLPAVFSQMKVDPFGVVWVVDDIFPASGTNLNKLDGSTWTNGIVTGGGGIQWYTSVAVDLLNCPTKTTCHVAFVAGGNGNVISLTTDGATAPTFVNSGGTGNVSYNADGGSDVTWHINYLTASATTPFNTVATFDRNVSNKLWAPGEGIFYTFPDVSGSAPIVYSEQTRGVEEFVSNKIISTPATPGAANFLSWDFPGFYTNSFTVFPSAIGLPPANAQTGLERGYSFDWVWNAPATVAVLVQDGSGSNSYTYDFSGVSLSSGTTSASFTKFTRPPAYTVTATGSTISAQTFSATGSITSNVLTLTAIGSGSPRIGATITGSGINTTITARLTGSPGSTGTFSVSNANAGSTTISGTYGLFTVGTVTTTANNLFTLGSFLAASGNVPSTVAPGFGPNMTELISGTGGSGSTFAVNNNTVVASQTIWQYSGESGGCIMLKDATHIAVIPVNSQAPPQFTTDGGVTWADTVIAGGTPMHAWGPFANFATTAKTCESDKGNGDLYAFNVNDSVLGGHRFYKSTDGGATYTPGMSLTITAPNFNINQQVGSAGITGLLFFTPGLQGGSHPNASTLWYYTTDGFASTFNTVTGFNEVLAFDYGASWNPGSGQPSIYANGWFSGTCLIGGTSQTCTNSYGTWMCKQFNTSTGACTTTWARLDSQYPKGVIAIVTGIAADKVTPGAVRVWTGIGAYSVQGTFLLEQDLPDNDNQMWLEKAA